MRKGTMGGAKAEAVRQALRDGFCYVHTWAGSRGELYKTPNGERREVSGWHLTRLWTGGEIGPAHDPFVPSSWIRLEVKNRDR